MVSYTLVSVVALVALVGGAPAVAYQCASAQYGSVAAAQQQLPDVPLAAGSQNYDFTIPPQACRPPSYTHVGTVVEACDDVTPDVWLNSLLAGQVHRNGDFRRVTAYLRVFVYCQP